MIGFFTQLSKSNNLLNHHESAYRADRANVDAPDRYYLLLECPLLTVQHFLTRLKCEIYYNANAQKCA